MKREEKESISEGLTQVWTWKDTIHREVAHLPVEEALRVIQQKARAVALKIPSLASRGAAPNGNKFQVKCL